MLEKRLKILILLTTITFLTFFVLLINSKKVIVKNENILGSDGIGREQSIPTPKLDSNSYSRQIEKNIKEIDKIFSDHKKGGNIDNRDKTVLDTINKLKQNLRSMYVPARYRDIHIQALLSVEHLSQYLESGKTEELSRGEKMIKAATSQYNELN